MSKKPKNKSIFILSALILLAVGFVLYMFFNHSGRNLFNIQSMTDTVKSYDIPNAFWGKVVDLEGNPIPDVDVELGVLKFSPNIQTAFTTTKFFKTKTDTSGLFSIQFSGRKVILKKLSKSGYEFTRESIGQTSFDLIHNSGNGVFIPVEEEPVVFRGRKQGKTACLRIWTDGISVSGGSKYFYVDLVKGRVLDSKQYKVIRIDPIIRNDFTPDLIIEIHNSDSRREIILHSNEDGGVVMSDQRVYMAPEEGYLSSQKIYIAEGKEQIVYALFQGRQSNLYAIVEMKIRQMKTDWLLFDIDVRSNIFASRVLDDDPTIKPAIRKADIDIAEEKVRKLQSVN